MSVIASDESLTFRLPPVLEASEPPEARGMARDEVRLMISGSKSRLIRHARFHDIAEYLQPGDLLVVNTSGTRNAAVDATGPDGVSRVAHLSTHLPDGRWVVELRTPAGPATVPFPHAKPGDRFTLPYGGSLTLTEAYRPVERNAVRLWIAEVEFPLADASSDEGLGMTWGPGGPIAGATFDNYLALHGRPIRYKYVQQDWPSEYYQTVWANEIGSAEMPSAGRAFTAKVLHRLRAKGVRIAPLVLHTGVASLETHEAPYDEYYRVPDTTATMINEAHQAGHRVIAVGTTVVRALETVTDTGGVTRGGEGWTDLVITPERGVRAVDGLITGLHEPEATHLQMLSAIADAPHLAIAYRAALQEHYLWHEFGDLHLLLGERRV